MAALDPWAVPQPLYLVTIPSPPQSLSPPSLPNRGPREPQTPRFHRTHLKASSLSRTMASSSSTLYWDGGSAM